MLYDVAFPKPIWPQKLFFPTEHLPGSAFTEHPAGNGDGSKSDILQGEKRAQSRQGLSKVLQLIDEVIH